MVSALASTWHWKETAMASGSLMAAHIMGKISPVTVLKLFMVFCFCFNKGGKVSVAWEPANDSRCPGFVFTDSNNTLTTTGLILFVGVS